MIPFTYAKAGDVAEAVRLGAAPGAKFLGGGTNLVDLLRETVERPAALVDVTGLSSTIKKRQDGGLMIGAAALNTALAEHREVRTRYPVLARAVLAGASGQIRNMATVGGNILQRTRCAYFYDTGGARCNKRSPGQGCDAIEGFNRSHAILGASSACVATHPSDMSVALAALDAVVHLHGADGARTVPLTELHRLPGEHPEIETVLEPGELITTVELPAPLRAAGSTYRKVRDRSSYAFALVSVAAVLEVHNGSVRTVRLALGGGALGRRNAHSPVAGHAPGVPSRGRDRTRRSPTLTRQRVQDRAGEPHDHRRTRRAGRADVSNVEGSGQPARHGWIGAALPRMDGPLKVQGRAPFAAEFTFEGMVYAALVFSTIAKGRIATIDTSAVEAVPRRRDRSDFRRRCGITGTRGAVMTSDLIVLGMGMGADACRVRLGRCPHRVSRTSGHGAGVGTELDL